MGSIWFLTSHGSVHTWRKMFKRVAEQNIDVNANCEQGFATQQLESWHHRKELVRLILR